MREAILITIPYSHYCEKARWALDRAGVPYREEPHLPLLSRLAALRRGLWSTVPILVAEQRVIPQSAAIVAFADAQAPADRRLVPDEPALRREVDALEQHLDRRLGPHARRWTYGRLLDEPLLAEIVAKGQTRVQATLVPIVLPIARGAIRRAYPDHALDRLALQGHRRRGVRGAAARLGDGRPFLCGDRLTAADVAFGALATAVVFPAEHGALFPVLDQLPPAMQDEVVQLRNTAAGQLALRLYREHRARR